jgi:hypothetical protein
LKRQRHLRKYHKKVANLAKREMQQSKIITERMVLEGILPESSIAKIAYRAAIHIAVAAWRVGNLVKRRGAQRQSS